MTKQNTAKAAQPATDLRQRAARARDAAGRFIRRSAPATGTDQDPALPVTALFNATWDAIGRALDAEVPDDLVADLQAAEGAAYDRLRAVRPTSPAGFRALAQTWAKLLEGERLGEPGMMMSDHAADSLIAGAGACEPVEASTKVQHPDAALFALGDQFMAAWVAEDAVELGDGEVDAGEEAADWKAYNDCKRIAEQIVRTPAVTTAGYGIKALLLARYDSEDSGPSRPIKPQGSFASDWNVLRQVQQGAARLAAAAPDMGSPMSAPADPVTGIPVSGSLFGERLPAPGHDLSQLSIVELARLYPVVVRVEEVMGSAENAPCFWEAPSTYRTPAGKIINREADRLSQLLSAIAQEMSRRQAADDDEAEERANTLLWHTVVTGGVAEHPELIAEINATWGA